MNMFSVHIKNRSEEANNLSSLNTTRSRYSETEGYTEAVGDLQRKCDIIIISIEVENSVESTSKHICDLLTNMH